MRDYVNGFIFIMPLIFAVIFILANAVGNSMPWLGKIKTGHAAVIDSINISFGMAALDMGSSNSADVTAGQDASVIQSNVQISEVEETTQTAGNASQTTAGGTSATDQSNMQTIYVGGDNPGTITLGENGQPSQVTVGAVQTAGNASQTTAGGTAETSQTNIQQASGTNAATQTAGNTDTSLAAEINSTQKTSQTINGASVVKESNLTLEMKNTADNYPIDSEAEIFIEKDKAFYTAKLKSNAAKYVEFYARKSGVSIAFYLGVGRAEDGLWKYQFDSLGYPNGMYSLYATIKTSTGNFQSKTVNFFIDNPVSGAQTTRISQDLDSAQIQLSSSYQQINKASDSLAQDIADNADLGENQTDELSGNIVAFSQTVQIIERLEDLLAQKQSQRQAVNDEISRLQAELQNLPFDALDSKRNELVLQIREANIKKQGLDGEIAVIGAAISQKVAEKKSAVFNIVDFTKSMQGVDVSSRIAELESEVLQNQQIANKALRLLQGDSDKDGLNDYEEQYVYRTNAGNPDTDGDGVLDGDEIVHGFNPLSPKDDMKIAYQDPRTVPPRQTELFKVEVVQSAKLDSGDDAIKLGGRGLPNSYITLYIYSQPLVVVVKTDADGRWQYILDKQLQDGLHTVYAAETNSLGQIQARSQEYVFLKRGSTVTRTTRASEASMASTIQQLERDFGFYTFFVILLALGIALLIIGFFSRLSSARFSH